MIKACVIIKYDKALLEINILKQVFCLQNVILIWIETGLRNSLRIFSESSQTSELPKIFKNFKKL